MSRHYPPLALTWGERYYKEHQIHFNAGALLEPLPPVWRKLKEEEAVVREGIARGQITWPPPMDESGLSSWMRRAPAHPFNIDYPQHFCGLEPVSRYVAGQVKMMREARDMYKEWRNLDPVGVMFTEVYTPYSYRRWEGYGKRTYVMDPDTFELLTNTDLPAMPAHQLRGPYETFWLTFPPETYYFGTDDVRAATKQEVEGVMVSFTDTSPEVPNRQLTMLIGGRASTAVSRQRGLTGGIDDSVVFFNETLDDRPLASLFERSAKESNLTAGHDEVVVLTPRAVLNFCLYMMSDQPDLTPVPPVPRRTFPEIKSPKQRASAIRNEDERMAHLSRVGYTYVGAALADVAEARVAAGLGVGRKLNRQVWVQGHWRFQAYGPGNSLRKLIHVRPYMKGPDLGEQVVIHRRVQPAMRAGE